MPIYEYVCVNCKMKFSETKSISAHDPKRVKCPKCKSRSVERRWSSINVTTSTKS
jgi:putative FmdB family regulatory protein